MRKCANISAYMRRPFVIYDFATAPLWIYLYMRKIWFSFYQCILPPPPPHFSLLTTFKETILVIFAGSLRIKVQCKLCTDVNKFCIISIVHLWVVFWFVCCSIVLFSFSLANTIRFVRFPLCDRVRQKSNHVTVESKQTKLAPVRVADPDPGSGAFLISRIRDPGWKKSSARIQNPGWISRIFFWELSISFWVKNI